MKLGDITSAVGVMRDEPGPRHSEIKFMLFDAPDLTSPAGSRIQHIQDIARKHPRWQATPMRIAKSKTELEDIRQLFLENVSPEGVMCLHPRSPYDPGLSPFLIKLKQWLKEEFTVTAVIEGNGKYAGTLGALKCLTAAGVEFEIGSFENLNDYARKILFATLKPGDSVVARFKEYGPTGCPIGAIYQAPFSEVE